MIGKLTGVIDETGADFAIVDVNGVGYVVQCAARTLSQLPPRGGRVALFVETQMREDAIRLFGFASSEEREWFRLLQSVQGVGAKVALAILSALNVSDLARAVAFEDKAQVGRAQGVGPKLAQRIVAELKDKAAAMSAPLAIAVSVGAKPVGAAGEALSALINLGYGRAEAQMAVAAALANAGEKAPVEALIRTGLKELAR